MDWPAGVAKRGEVVDRRGSTSILDVRKSPPEEAEGKREDEDEEKEEEVVVKGWDGTVKEGGKKRCTWSWWSWR